MTIINLIAAVDENFGLGKNNQLLCKLPADLKYFKKITMHHPIIMGHKTFASIGKPLPGRRNIVLTKQNISYPEVETVPSLAQALSLVDTEKEIYIIGGAQVFNQAMPMADVIYLTLIHHCYEADVFFPHLDKNIWQLTHTENYQRDEKNSHDLTFCRYQKITN